MSSSFATASIFLLHGLIFATWVCRIPAAQRDLSLSPGVLGLVLLSTSLGSLLSMPATGWLVARYGSRPIVILSSFLFCLTLIPLAWAGSAFSLGLALGLFGAAARMQNVSMNANAVFVEQQRGRPIMSTFHALFSLGAMIASAAGGWLAGHDVTRVQHFVGACLLLLMMTGLAVHGLARTPPAPAQSLSLSFPLGLGLLAFCILIGEGAMADWSGVYLSSVLGTDTGRAALGYAAFSLAMVAGRFSGDYVTARFGRPRVVRTGALIALGGLSLGLVTGLWMVALLGFGVVGLGLSVITPNVFGAAGRVSSTALAAVTTAGYLGFLTGPPLIGGIAQVTGLRLALVAVVVSLAAGSVLARATE